MTRTRMLGLLAAGLLAAALAGPARGAGMLLPKEPSVPPLAIKYLRVDATIENQAATTRIVQEFQNSTGRDLECTYIFPLPARAAIRDFALYIGGKRMKGELLEKDRARQVYEEIVRRAKDPGLLEYLDGQLLRMRIYPVPARGTQKVELEYTELIPMDNGLAEYVFPLRTGEQASRTLEDFTVAVRLKSETPIKTVYSPTHEVGVSRPSDHEAVAGMETKGAVLDKDFHLFYTVSRKDFGLSLMTYRPDPKGPGMFLVLVSPKSEVNADQRVPRDLAFVLDTSGSMKGEKIEQAKRALKFCIQELDPKDRFAIVQFSTMAQTFPDAGQWSDAGEASKQKAAAWIEAFEAAGGTNIGEALQRVLALPADADRPVTVLFLTDGRPTVNVTDIEALSKMVKDRSAGKTRFFTFGVGDDVNAHLLDRLSGETGGLPEYVRPGEAIDGKVTRLYSKMSYPVLVDLALEVPGVKVVETYPRQLPDLFRGSQLVLVGAYTGSGDSVLRLKGKVGQRQEEFVYEGTFPEKTAERSFIGPLYAHRKIGYLLDQVRLHGENAELKDEVVRLSLKYGIETPYTSYLVLESEQQYKQYGIERYAGASLTGASVPTAAATGGLDAGGRPSAGPAGAAAANQGAARRAEALEGLKSAFGDLAKPAIEPPARGRDYRPAPEGPASSTTPSEFHGRAGADEAGGGYPYRGAADSVHYSGEPAGLRADESKLRTEESGKDAVDIAQALARMQRKQTLGEKRDAYPVQERAGRRFVRYRGVWVDERFEGTEGLTKVKWGSDAYFKLVREKPDLKDVFTLGRRLVVATAKGKALVVDIEDGREELPDEDLKALFTDAAP